jgi:AraC family transcriptional regulator
MRDAVEAITCGQPLASLAGHGFTITDVRYRGGDTYAPHAHAAAYVMLVRNGGFHESARRAEVELTSGGVIAVPAGFPHRDVIAPRGAHGLLVTFDAWSAAAPREWRACRGGEVSRTMIRLAAILGTGGHAEMLAIEESLLIAAAQLGGGAPETIDRRAVRVAAEVLEAELDRPLRLRDVAARAGVTSSYLARAFRRCTGRTMGSYLRAARARRAAALLASSADDAADVAVAAGFADQSHLSRVFKAEYGLTPQRYRQLMARSNSFKT